MANQDNSNELQIRSKSIQQAKDILANNGFSVNNLWNINDVLSVVKCNKAEAHDILQNALTNEAVMEQIWYAIKDYAEINEFELKDNN